MYPSADSRIISRIKKLESRFSKLYGEIESSAGIGAVPPGDYPLLLGLTVGQPLRATSATTAAFGALDLANANAITGIMPVSYLGTTQAPTFGSLNLGSATGATAGDVIGESATASFPQWIIRNTNADADGGYLFLEKQSASPANADVLGSILYRGYNSTPLIKNFAFIRGTAAVVTAAAEMGKLELGVAVNGTGTTQLTITNTNATLVGALNIGSASGTTAGEVQASAGIKSLVDGSGGGLYAGTAADVQLYRSSATAWRTPDGLMVDLGLTVGELFGAGPAAGAVYATQRDAGTNNLTNAFILARNSSGTPAAGFGIQQSVVLESSTTDNQSILDINSTWVVATHASRTSRTVFNVYDFSAARETLRLEASGTAAMIGFLGASAIVRPASTDDLRTALINLGLYTTGGASPLNLNAGAFTAGSINVGTASGAAAGAIATSAGVVIGLSTETASADLNVVWRDTATNTQVSALQLSHRSSGTPAANFGVQQILKADSDTNTQRTQGVLESRWVVATDATRTARFSLSVADTSNREFLRGQASGTAAMIGFLGAAAVVKQATITQTYSTTGLTLTQGAMTDPAAYGAGANGYSTGAMASAIHAEVIALKANMVTTQNVLNSVIDALQAYGLMG